MLVNVAPITKVYGHYEIEVIPYIMKIIYRILGVCETNCGHLCFCGHHLVGVPGYLVPSPNAQLVTKVLWLAMKRDPLSRGDRETARCLLLPDFYKEASMCHVLFSHWGKDGPSIWVFPKSWVSWHQKHQLDSPRAVGHLGIFWVIIYQCIPHKAVAEVSR